MCDELSHKERSDDDLLHDKPAIARYLTGIEQSKHLHLNSPKGVQNAFSIQVRMESEVFGLVGDSVKLWCSFSSLYPISDSVTVDWSYRLPEGGPTVTILHFQSKAYPILMGPFKDRVQWEGNVKRGDASISLSDLRLTDNGTLSCTVRNPPDVHGNVPQTKLTVTLKSVHFKFTSALLLSVVVLIPSALVILVLLIRMWNAIRRGRSRNEKWKRCSIEDSKECVCDDHTSLIEQEPYEQSPGCLMRCCLKCMELAGTSAPTALRERRFKYVRMVHKNRSI
ncbi:myelin protein zero-like protein 3 [Pelodytes ibericus]